MSEIKINLTKEQLLEIDKIIRLYLPTAKIFLFGSRLYNKNTNKYADIDIAIDNGNELELLILSNLREGFSNSSIPFKVDLCDYHSLNDSFKQIIDNNHFLLKI